MFDGYGMGGFGGPFMLLWWVLIVLAVVAIVRWLMMPTSTGRPERRTPLEILEERYARGEIDAEEFRKRKQDLTE